MTFLLVEMAGAPGAVALPPSLAYLASLDQLIVKQKKEMLESKYRKIPENSDNRKVAVIILKFELCGFPKE